MVEEKFSLINKTKCKMPILHFVDMKEKILGKDYSLSIAYISESKMREINKGYRQKDKPTNILSFPLSKKSGEILICPNILKKETKKFNRNIKDLLGYLLIHGMLHLKGMDHGKKMEKFEDLYCKKLSFKKIER